ncbi:MAG TPA: polysaccharide biosynthesis/export family protein [Longimicrobium sp.]|jgi:polysaccharide export outer membrane protein|uniref:polysaccharide biosynthesis/export family protein n=1 Tax=Longimicrobium sp. TaxID=2029185 RepID=UPI002ED8402F
MRRIFLLLILTVLGAVPAAAQTASDISVRPGDQIRIAVWRQAEFTGDFNIGPDGTIQHPLLAEVRVVGSTRAAIREQILRTLQRYDRDPQFVFDFLYRVGVSGEVRLPSLYTLTPETTLPQALAAAGGPAESARLDQAVLLRNGQETVIDLLRPTPEVAAMKIQSGDILRIPRRTQRLRETVSFGSSIIAAAASLAGAFLILRQN